MGVHSFLAIQKVFFDEKFLRGRVSGQNLRPPWGEHFFNSPESVFQVKKRFFVTQGGEGGLTFVTKKVCFFLFEGFQK